MSKATTNVAPAEAETFWIAFLRQLARRGLRGVNFLTFGAEAG